MPPKGYTDGFGNSYDPRTDYEELQEMQAFSRSEKVSGRPERETIIQEDDITNLKIALGTAQSLEHFLEVV